jgi:hypothetical protein
MTITNREDSLAGLAEVLSKEQMANIVSHNYSDQALAVMAEFDRGYVERFADTMYDSESMEKLIGAYCDKLIDWKDLLHIAEYSCYDFSSEEYLDQFIRSIEAKEINHTIASRILTATAYEFDTYNGLMEFVKSGAYYPTQYASICLNTGVAAELRDLGVPLTAMRKDGTYYDLTQKSEFDEAAKNGDRIKLVKFPKLAVTVNEMMAYPDWRDFKMWFQQHQGIDRTQLTSDELGAQYRYFSMERYADKLVDKVIAEHSAFIENMKKCSPEEIIGSAYEIVIKEQIKMFMTEVPQYLQESKTDALMSSNNALNAIYEQWRSDDDFADTDIEIIIENTADKLIAAREREQKLAAELAKKTIADDFQDKPHFKPGMKHGR